MASEPVEAVKLPEWVEKALERTVCVCGGEPSHLHFDHCPHLRAVAFLRAVLEPMLFIEGDWPPCEIADAENKIEALFDWARSPQQREGE